MGSLKWPWVHEWNAADADEGEVSSALVGNPRTVPHPAGGVSLSQQMLAIPEHMLAGDKLLFNASRNFVVIFISPSPRVSCGTRSIRNSNECLLLAGLRQHMVPIIPRSSMGAPLCVSAILHDAERAA
jgi:hypothetical protein